MNLWGHSAPKLRQIRGRVWHSVVSQIWSWASRLPCCSPEGRIFFCSCSYSVAHKSRGHHTEFWGGVSIQSLHFWGSWVASSLIQKAIILSWAKLLLVYSPFFWLSFFSHVTVLMLECKKTHTYYNPCFSTPTSVTCLPQDSRMSWVPWRVFMETSPGNQWVWMSLPTLLSTLPLSSSAMIPVLIHLM